MPTPTVVAPVHEHLRHHLYWRPETMDLFSAVCETPIARRYLIVERLPDGGWDWVAWDEPARPLYGQAESVDAAMQDAEQAAIALAGQRVLQFTPRRAI